MVCPGHIDLYLDGTRLTIKTSDDAPTIGSLRISPEVCQAFTSDLPKTGPDGVAKVTIYPSFRSASAEQAITATCTVDVTSVHGETVQLTSTVSYYPRSMQQCPMNDNCCAPSRVSWVSSTSVYPNIQTVTFLWAPDASADAPHSDAVLDIPRAANTLID